MLVALTKASRPLLSGWVAGKTPATLLKGKDGRIILLAHGTKAGRLTVDDSTLAELLPHVESIVCCYPARVAAVYSRMFPELPGKLLCPEVDEPQGIGVVVDAKGKFCGMSVIPWSARQVAS